jgi:ABC-type oligopeptide transport system substrate-binding subunit
LVLLLALLSLTVGVLGGTARAQDSMFTCPTTGGTFITAITSDPVSLNNILANDGASVTVLSYIFNSLTLGGENWGKEISGDLAESWSSSDDGLE